MEEQIIKILRDSIALSTNRNTIYTETAAGEIASHFNEFIEWLTVKSREQINSEYLDWLKEVKK